jgi:hypothetical protein
MSNTDNSGESIDWNEFFKDIDFNAPNTPQSQQMLPLFHEPPIYGLDKVVAKSRKWIKKQIKLIKSKPKELKYNPDTESYE